MPVIVLLRHGLSSANTAGILAGRAPGVSLTEDGVRALEDTLRMLPRSDFSRLLHSPLTRCAETAAIAARFAGFGTTEVAEDFIELDYGDWTGRRLEDLVTTPEWETVAQRASQMRFPGGESITEAADRAVAGVAGLVAELRAVEEAKREAAQASAEEAGKDGGDLREWAMVVSHGDIIKAIIADALGMPLDDFQRLSVAPGSFTVIDYTGRMPVMTAMSITAAGLSVSGVPGGGGLA
ncbi:histidine phosphatase family protein [Brevibacterium casei]|uniref:Phosphoglycerate/bisphosphoglycerate mutase n=1 Tax=Brevibacterium casei S18 TaxID=1229781 RepID=K9AQN6_9MICO|nr:histidine phosphatase family protein [Brevibacterium casei]EKU49758.1 phosphoglycerate/bisphosphoglycerate mutase [Brevibacterium casei S18]MBE4693846.1 phosphoglycerate mutase [Brevibacterium casei]MBY3576969.1 phosphoglycerate mutase [Brevibacterium casei]MCT2182293.1 histidine phosphatase family protein [Brevibacterium casei]MCT2358202.1 histidine phosphatase family protein [Brevibacterium casei]